MVLNMIEVQFSDNSYIIVGIDKALQSHVNGYLHYLSVVGKSPNTVRTYAYHICLWLRYCDEYGIHCLSVGVGEMSRPIDTFTGFMRWLQYPDLREGILHLSGEAPARTDRTVNLIMSAVLSFYSYLSADNVLPPLPLYRPQKMNGSYKPFLSELYHHSLIKDTSILKKPEATQNIQFITRDQYKEMLRHCYLLRDKLIIALLFEGGLRLGEALGMHLSDLNQLEEGIVKITPRNNNENGARVKRMAGGSIKVPDYVVAGLLDYINSDRSNYDSEYLFIAFSGPRKGLALKADSVEKLFDRISKEMNLEIHPHMLRHGFATEKLAAGWELMDIQAYLRHKSIRTTEIYAFYSNELKIRKMQTFFEVNNAKLKESADAIIRQKTRTDQ